jgi:hypothetical protein
MADARIIRDVQAWMEEEYLFSENAHFGAHLYFL